MPLITYDEKLELLPFGFRNLGSTCYFNALLQAMLSCTSFTKKILQINRSQLHNNSIVALFTELIGSTNTLSERKSLGHDVTNDEKTLHEYSPKIWHTMVNMICQKNKIPVRSFMMGQQCVGEGFHHILDTMENFQQIQNLFLHRYKSIIRCFNCNKWVSDVENVYSLFEVEPDLKIEQIEKFQKYHLEAADMNEFLSKKSSYVDEAFVCPSCKERGEKYRMDILVMIPEILVVMSKKYTVGGKLDIYTDFPKRLEFKGLGGDMKYEAVAQIEHSGGINGGHYWSICRRKNGWYNINDMSVHSAQFQPTKKTYIVFYHLM